MNHHEPQPGNTQRLVSTPLTAVSQLYIAFSAREATIKLRLKEIIKYEKVGPQIFALDPSSRPPIGVHNNWILLY